MIEGGAPVADIGALVAAHDEALSLDAQPPTPPAATAPLAADHTDPARLARGDEQSFSSPDDFVYRPFACVLKHKAHMLPGSLVQNQIASEGHLHGNLTHRVAGILVRPSSVSDFATSGRLLGRHQSTF